MILTSSLARWAPRQKCGPPRPKLTWLLGLRPMSNRQRIGEDALVEVGRRVPDDHLVARPDLRPAQLDVAGGGAAEVQHRRRPAQDLLDRGRHERRVGAQPRHLVGVVHERLHAVRDRLAGGLVAGDDEQQEHRVELLLGQALPVDLGLDELRHDVVAGVLAGARQPGRGRSGTPRARPGCGTAAAGTGRCPGARRRCRRGRGRSSRSWRRPTRSAACCRRAARPGSRTGRGSAAPPRRRRRSRTRPCGSARSRMCVVSSRSRPSYAATARGVKPRFTSARRRVCRGGSVSSIDLRASIASGSRSSSAVAPVSDEYVAVSLCTATRSSWRVTAQ